MIAPPIETPETEAQRRRLLEELAAERPAPLEESFGPGTMGCHELLDRTALALDMIDKYIRSHPSCVLRADWFALAEHAQEALGELYQRVGADHLAADEAGAA